MSEKNKIKIKCYKIIGTIILILSLILIVLTLIYYNYEKKIYIVPIWCFLYMTGTILREVVPRSIKKKERLNNIYKSGKKINHGK